MDINFIIFFIFLLITLIVVENTEDGMMLIVFGLFFGAIFANTQSASPLFFSNSDLLGFGAVFNTFWLILLVLCFVKSFFIAKSNGLFKIGKNDDK